jgi:MFS family permease
MALSSGIPTLAASPLLYDTVADQQARNNSMAQPVEIPYPARAIAWYATLILAFLYWISLFDRFIISLLVGPIKRDLGLSDVQFGMLNGFGFTVTFSLFGLLAGVLTDHRSRRWVIFVGVAVWSAATAACGIAQNYTHMLLARVGVGVGEASLNPAATSMISDLFPRDRLGTAITVFGLGSTIGAGTAFIFGGSIVEAVSRVSSFDLPLIGAVRSWQTVFFMLGIPGALLAFIIFTVPEPARRGLRNPAGSSQSWLATSRQMIAFMNSRRRFFTCHYLGFLFASTGLVGAVGWYPAHMSRHFHWSPSRVGLTLGLLLGIGGMIGQLLGGAAMDAMYRRGRRDAPLRWFAVSVLLAAPFGIIATTSSSPLIFVIALFGYFVCIQSMPTAIYTALNLVTPNELRGTGSALFNATSGLIGAGAGPVVVAMVSDYLYKDESAIGLAIATVMAVVFPLAAATLAFGMRPMRETVVAADAQTLAH